MLSFVNTIFEVISSLSLQQCTLTLHQKKPKKFADELRSSRVVHLTTTATVIGLIPASFDPAGGGGGGGEIIFLARKDWGLKN
jgi:hypothetical protein